MADETIALALAAGGARGAYHAGAMLFLTEQGVKFDMVAGTSIGALNGAYYAQGDSSSEHLEQLVKLWRAIPDAGIIQLNGKELVGALASFLSRQLPDISRLISYISGRKITILDPKPIASLLDKWIDYEKVCNSRIDMTVAVLAETDPLIDIIIAPWRRATYLQACQLGPAKLRQSLLAAAAIPLAFPSQEVEGGRFADAGLVDPLPAQVLYQRGARRMVSVFLSDGVLQDRAEFHNCLMFQIRPSTRIDSGLRATFDFSQRSIDRLIDLGYQDARASYTDARELYERLVWGRERAMHIQALADSLPERRKK